MIQYNPIIQSINYNGFDISILRLDLLHPEVSGNKWFKLKYNLNTLIEQKKSCVITFGGAFSNHIAATAAACKQANILCIGIIRGEELSHDNETLLNAKKNGMQIIGVSREEYKQKNNEEYLQELIKKFPNSYIIPEGGDNELGAKGCSDILTSETLQYNKIFCACGTSTTFKGISYSLKDNQFLYGVNVLKFDAVSDFENATILNDYHFGGYAKHTPELLNFKTWFERTYAIPLDYVYTAKLMYAVFDLINNNKLTKEDAILVIHSGGLQGNTSYEKRYNLNPNRQVIDPIG